MRVFKFLFMHVLCILLYDSGLYCSLCNSFNSDVFASQHIDVLLITKVLLFIMNMNNPPHFVKHKTGMALKSVKETIECFPQIL